MTRFQSITMFFEHFMQNRYTIPCRPVWCTIFQLDSVQRPNLRDWTRILNYRLDLLILQIERSTVDNTIFLAFFERLSSWSDFLHLAITVSGSLKRFFVGEANWKSDFFQILSRWSGFLPPIWSSNSHFYHKI